MRTETVNNWLSIVANVGVIIGLVLVAYEINQSTRTTRAQMINDHYDRWVTIDLSWQNQDFAAAWAKAMENPDDLTLTEMVQLNGLMWSFFDHTSTNGRLWDLGVLSESDETLENMIVNGATIFLGNRYAQAWIEENRANISPRAAAILEKALEDLESDATLDSYRRIKTRIAQ
jgi:hypothetical protein